MSIEKAELMTRTALVIAFYYHYNRFNIDEKKSFVDVLDDYTDPYEGLNYYLEKAGYQPVNEKSIFDLAVIFSSYAYLND